MITADSLRTAIKTSHDHCKGANGCVHADAFAECGSDIEAYAVQSQSSPLAQFDPILAAIFQGVHLGYRLHQLETEQPIDAHSPKVN